MIRLDTILEQVRSYAPDADLGVIRKAWVFASKYHAGQRRKNRRRTTKPQKEAAPPTLAGLRFRLTKGWIDGICHPVSA